MATRGRIRVSLRNRSLQPIPTYQIEMHKFSELFRHDFNTSARLLSPKSTKPTPGNTATEVEVHSQLYYKLNSHTESHCAHRGAHMSRMDGKKQQGTVFNAVDYRVTHQTKKRDVLASPTKLEVHSNKKKLDYWRNTSLTKLNTPKNPIRSHNNGVSAFPRHVITLYNAQHQGTG